MQQKCQYCGTFETDIIFHHVRCSTPGCRAYSNSIAQEYQLRREKLEKLKKQLEKIEKSHDSLIKDVFDMDDT